jgi:hypothetical protein
MMVNEHDSVVLTEALPASGLEAEDVGVVVHVYPGGRAFEVEFIALDGSTVAIEMLEPHQIRPIRSREVPHARPLAVAG